VNREHTLLQPLGARGRVSRNETETGVSSQANEKRRQTQATELQQGAVFARKLGVCDVPAHVYFSVLLNRMRIFVFLPQPASLRSPLLPPNPFLVSPV
jgi:hypothetical protein